MEQFIGIIAPIMDLLLTTALVIYMVRQVGIMREQSDSSQKQTGIMKEQNQISNAQTGIMDHQNKISDFIADETLIPELRKELSDLKQREKAWLVERQHEGVYDDEDDNVLAVKIEETNINRWLEILSHKRHLHLNRSFDRMVSGLDGTHYRTLFSLADKSQS